MILIIKYNVLQHTGTSSGSLGGGAEVITSAPLHGSPGGQPEVPFLPPET